MLTQLIIGTFLLAVTVAFQAISFDVIIKKNQQNSKFKQIFDNLDETVFIVNKNKIQIGYANNFFFK